MVSVVAGRIDLTLAVTAAQSEGAGPILASDGARA